MPTTLNRQFPLTVSNKREGIGDFYEISFRADKLDIPWWIRNDPDFSVPTLIVSHAEYQEINVGDTYWVTIDRDPYGERDDP